MNTKVTQIVELLFRDVQPSEEVLALRDEVLNNCQDRFEDLVRNGLGEEEALAAVMESLKGMEDVLKDYPRKESRGEARIPEEKKEAEAGADAAEEPDRACFDPAQVKAIHAQLAGCDVEVAESAEGVVLEKQGKVHYRLEENGTLRVWQEKVTENLFRGISWEDSFTSFEHLGDAMNRLAQNVSQLISGKMGEWKSETGTRLALRLPAELHPAVNIHTTGGDISWEGAVPGESFVLGSTSGDIRVRTDESVLLPQAEISTTSGDVELRMSAGTVRMNSVSGDLSWKGDAGALEMNSTSGDADVSGRIRKMDVSSTSGDLNLRLAEDASSEVEANTVSGEINIWLPEEEKEVAAVLSSVSGELRTRGVDLVAEAPFCIRAKTVSGDLKISHEGFFRG